MGCFRYIVVNTLHKGDNKDDNDGDNNKSHIYFVVHLFHLKPLYRILQI
jgi:hypothetical protein